MKNLIIGDKGYIGTELHRHIEAVGIDMSFKNSWVDIAKGYDTIILLAGHSSKPMGENDPDGCWQNNVIRFKTLLDNLRDDQRLIYASSASVYNQIKSTPTEECAEFHPLNMYDLSKYTIDQLAKLANKHTYGLRFVTVNGYSDTLRIDLMINKMVEDAKTKGEVTIKNGNLTRPILDIQDCCRAIKTVVKSKEDNRGIYNLNSFNGHTVRDFAEAVTKRFGGKVTDLGNEPHYVYGADTLKFRTTYNFKFKGSLKSILKSLEKEPKEKVIRA